MWAALYPGQGSQHPGMGKFLFEEFKLARELFEEAGDALHLDFKKLLFDGSEADLALTHNTQPALLLVSTTTYRVLDSLVPLKVAAAAGHSVGEYAAIVCAGGLSLTDGLKAVRKRGEFMQTAVPVGKGAMLALLGLESEQVMALCRWAQDTSKAGVVEPANFNAPGQIVISGSAPAIQWLQDHYSESAFTGAPKKLKAIPLKVSAPFHCSLMKPAEDQMRDVLKGLKFSATRYPIVQNFSAKAESEPETLRENLIRQISGAVRWIECVQHLSHQGVTQCIEFGSGKILAGLVKKIASEKLSTLNINSMEELKNLENLMTQSAGAV